jgi:diaminopimelate decarboxylase
LAIPRFWWGFWLSLPTRGAVFNWGEFGAVLSAKLNKPLDLIIEPGRAAIAGCAMLLTRVVSVKFQQEKQIVGVDTTVANLSVPSVHGGYRQIVAFNLGEASLVSNVCGNTTYSRDYLGRNCFLPKLAEGDILGILDVGAYGYAMSSHFLHRPRPAEVLLESQQHRLIRAREDYGVLLSNQII